MYAYYTNGMVMEYIIDDRDKDEQFIMTVTDIDLNKENSISTTDYNIMDMSSMMPDEEAENEESVEED